MNTKIRLLTIFIAVLTIAAFLAPSFNSSPAPAEASHSWGNYHWARSANPVSIPTGDNVDATWDGHMDLAISDWNASSVINLVEGAGQAKGKCRPTEGRIEVCNDAYGQTGWLGIAQIWASGDHITQGTAKMNDTYFNTASYNTPAWRQLVMCQEIAHAFGLGHQDEAFDNPNLNTCMDYTSNPDSNQHPNNHDFQQLSDIYAHLDSGGSSGGNCNGNNPNCNGNNGIGNSDFNHPSEWGQLVHSHGQSAVYERDFGNGNRMITHVFWAE